MLRKLSDIELDAVSGGGSNTNQTNVSTGDGNLQQNQNGKYNIQVGLITPQKKKHHHRG